MRTVFVALLVCGVLTAIVYGFDLAEILEKIPEENPCAYGVDERIDFMKYHISKGRDLTIASKDTKDLKKFDEFPLEFSVYMYETAIENPITDEDRLKELREVICFDDGTCIDVGDIGVHPF